MPEPTAMPLYELESAIKQAALLVNEIKVVATVTIEEPTKIVAGRGKCQACILMQSGTLGQNATQSSRELHNLTMRFYVPMNRDRPDAEAIMREALSEVQAKFEKNIGLNGSPGVVQAIIEGNYSLNYQNVGGVMQRVMDVPLQVEIRTTRTWVAG